MSITEDDIFFGSERCYFRHVPGITEEFTNCDDYHFATEISQVRQQTVHLSQKHKLDHQLHPIVVPGIPAINILPNNDFTSSDDIEKCGTLSYAFPEILKRPLIKCSVHHPECLNQLYGIKSGVRSGLIKHENMWYRLKGCGNSDEGFISKLHEIPSTASSSDKESWQEIRGCAFLNTSLRELYYTSMLSTCPHFQAKGIISANRALGLSHYTQPSEALFGTQPLVRPVCILEATTGDRRFGSHVLAGLELILPLLLDTDALDMEKLHAVFPPNRPREHVMSSEEGEGSACSSPLSGVVSTDRFICDYCLGTSLLGHGDDPDCQGLCWQDTPRDATTLANLLLPSCQLPERAPFSPSNDYPKQWTTEGSVDMPPSWQVAWNRTCSELSSQLQSLHAKAPSSATLGSSAETPTSGVLAYLYACAGFDAGNFLRELHNKRLSWGTFQDTMCRKELDEWHCNAHSNNFVLLPPPPTTPLSAGVHQPMLSFLDLDMAYSADTFLTPSSTAENESSVTVGVSDEAFNSVLWKEYVNLMEVLAGSDATSGVPQVAKSTVQKHSSASVQGVKSALTDTLILAYIDAYNGKKHPYSGETYDPDLHSAAYSVLKLAVMVMAPFVA